MSQSQVKSKVLGSGLKIRSQVLWVNSKSSLKFYGQAGLNLKSKVLYMYIKCVNSQVKSEVIRKKGQVSDLNIICWNAKTERVWNFHWLCFLSSCIFVSGLVHTSSPFSRRATYFEMFYLYTKLVKMFLHRKGARMSRDHTHADIRGGCCFFV